MNQNNGSNYDYVLVSIIILLVPKPQLLMRLFAVSRITSKISYVFSTVHFEIGMIQLSDFDASVRC